MALGIKFWGVRGSHPRPQLIGEVERRVERALGQFFDEGYRQKADIGKFLNGLNPYKYGGVGGNTLCIEVVTQEDSIIIDAGTGILVLSEQLMNGPCGRGKGEIHIFLTHFHWDHVETGRRSRADGLMGILHGPEHEVVNVRPLVTRNAEASGQRSLRVDS